MQWVMPRVARPSRLRGALVLGAVAALAAGVPAAALDAPADPPAPASCTIRFPEAQTIAAGLLIQPVHAGRRGRVRGDARRTRRPG